MNTDFIQEKLLEILKDFSSEPTDVALNINLPLAGPPFYLDAIHLYEFIMIVESTFHVKLLADDFPNDEMLSIASFERVINSHFSNRSCRIPQRGEQANACERKG